MTVNIKKDGDKITVAPCGRIDTVTAPEFEKAIKENCDGFASVVFDLTDLEYISSAGLRVILTSQKHYKSKLKLTHVAEAIMEVFEITGFADILTIE